jgi:hypothetical protein
MKTLKIYSFAAALVLSNSATAQGVLPAWQKGDLLVATENVSAQIVSPIDGTLKNRIVSNVPGSSGAAEPRFLPNGELLIASFDGREIAHFASNGRVIGTFGPTMQRPESILPLADGRVLIGNVDPGRLSILSANGTLLSHAALRTESRGVDFLDVSRDGKTMYYTSEGSSIFRYDLEAGVGLPNYAQVSGGSGGLYKPRLLPDGRLVAASTKYLVVLDANGVTKLRMQFRRAEDIISSVHYGLSLDPDVQKVWSTDLLLGNLVQFDLNTGIAEKYFAVSSAITRPPGGFDNNSLSDVTIVGEYLESLQIACPDLRVRRKPGSIQLLWPDSGAVRYAIERRQGAANFVQIATTQSRLSTYLDRPSVAGSYDYRLQVLDAQNKSLCQSRVLSTSLPDGVTPQSLNSAPIFLSKPESVALPGVSYRYRADVLDVDAGDCSVAFTGCTCWHEHQYQRHTHLGATRTRQLSGPY